MKVAITALILVGVFVLSGWDGIISASMEALHPEGILHGQTPETMIEQVKAAFDSAWFENLQKADLVTMLKAAAGLTQE